MLVGHEDDDIVAASRRELDVVGDDQDAAAEGAADLLDQIVEDVRPAHVDALGRLVENQQVGPLDQRPRQQQPLELAAGERRDGRIAEPLQADRVERGLDLPAGKAPRQRHQAAERERQRRAYGEALGHIAHRHVRRPLDRPLVDFDQAEHGLGAGRLAGTVGADHVDQRAARHLDVDVPDDPALASPDADVAGADKRCRPGGRHAPCRHVLRLYRRLPLTPGFQEPVYSGSIIL